MRVRYNPRALRQLDEIFDYVARDNAAATRRLVARIDQVIRLLGLD
jgi:plasmid stabilization system protein ParE